MSILNVEIKARSNQQEKIRKLLISKKADFKGIDHQIDTYFNVNNGRLKLREGSIENNLIHYQRENKKGPKGSEILLYHTEPETSLKAILTKSLGTIAEVDKQREIYFFENVKFHIDSVQGLGTFVEIEAIDVDGSIGRERLLEQCNYYLNLFEIKETDLISDSYSDLIMRQ